MYKYSLMHAFFFFPNIHYVAIYNLLLLGTFEAEVYKNMYVICPVATALDNNFL